ncbi:reverse transcriptase [Gossypium australe]|uniref:Reverse transcriptase n=1 Tax=Gossypium australe TaxID=47621 RepID=A0A5B6UR06_9ROSI|nr:reverse transcriptase [Gossypium australe]
MVTFISNGKERDDGTLARIIDTKIHLNMEIDKYEVYWEQRARANWLQLGDKNTAYFHKCATVRKWTNSISKLVADDGRGIGNDRKALEGIRQSISQEKNEQYWHIVGKEVPEYCLSILNGNARVDLINVTEIVLIPKIPNPSSLDNFRPISLCSVIYKIVAKAVANRLQNVIGLCIDEVQSAFVPGRLITDNVLLAYEILHTFRQKRTGRKGYMASRRGPEISNLLFADDCMMFSEATEQEARNMKDILKEYKTCSGVRSSSSPEKYLGLPNVVGKRKKEAFQSILDKITLRIESWSTSSKEEGGLGFRSMAQFNIALLAKQCWRLMNSPNSLVACVFKAKYFPDGNFHFSSLGRSSSFVWRSIWASKGTLESGLFWKVGTGENISVFEDAWIPNYDNARLTVGVGNSHFVKVVELINSNEREWNRYLIGNTFPEADAELILRISLAMEPHEDLLVWSGELSGEFSVRSSYKLLQNSNPTAYALQNIYRGFYNKLWRIDIPTKIKIFIWKISWNFLATRVNMAIKKLTSSRLCPRCAAGEETMNHLFRDCSVSVAIWKDLSDFISIILPHIEFVEWLTMGMANLSLNKCRFFCVTLWAIWGDKNSCIHEKTNRSSMEIASFIHRYIMKLEGIRKINHNSTKRNVEWKNPPEQTVKINFDGAFDERPKQSASRVVVRDCNGSILLTNTDLHKGVASAFVAEALACRRATQIALDINREEVIIEGDSLSIIKKCNNRDLDKSQVGSYIHDIYGLKSRAKTVRFEFVP